MDQASKFVSGSTDGHDGRGASCSSSVGSSWAENATSHNYKANFPSVGESSGQKKKGNKYFNTCVATIQRAPQHSGVVYKLEFPRASWSMITFSNISTIALKYALETVQDITKDIVDVNEFKLVIYLNDDEKLLLSDSLINAFAKHDIDIRDVSSLTDTGDSGNKPDFAELSLFNSPPLLPRRLANMVIIQDIIGKLIEEKDFTNVITSILSTLPISSRGFSILIRPSPIKTYQEKHPEYFDGVEGVSFYSPLGTLLSGLANAINMAGERVGCTTHPDVKVVRHIAGVKSILTPAKDGFATSVLSLSSPPHSDCLRCQILRLALIETNSTPASPLYVEFDPEILMLGVIRSCAAIQYMARNILVESTDVRSTDHATVVNLICNRIRTSSTMSRLGVTSSTCNIDNRRQRAIVFYGNPATLSQQHSALHTLLIFALGELHLWGYNGCMLIDQAGNAFKISSGLSAATSHLYSGQSVIKRWPTDSSINNILEFKTISLPSYNEELIRMIEDCMARSFQQVLNKDLDTKAKININKNNTDSRFNFTTAEPIAVLKSVKTAIESGELMIEILSTALLKAAKTGILRRARDVNSIKLAVVVKMKLNPLPPKSQRDTSALLTRDELVKINSKTRPHFFTSTPFTFNVEHIREKMEESDAASQVITMKKTNEQICEAVMDAIDERFAADITFDDSPEEKDVMHDDEED